MTFEEILDQAIAMLQRRGRLTCGTLKRQFQQTTRPWKLKNELIKGQRLARDEDSEVLVWTGDAAPPAALAPPLPSTGLTPLAYAALPGREDPHHQKRHGGGGKLRQVTVLFADLKKVLPN